MVQVRIVLLIYQGHKLELYCRNRGRITENGAADIRVVQMRIVKQVAQPFYIDKTSHFLL